MKKLTLVTVTRDNKILLGYKKRGFAQGNWNGFGGKVEAGEGVQESALRELKEECGISPRQIFQRGILNFYNPFNSGEELEVHLFVVNDFAGEPQESDEVRPEWFTFENIPYDSMWVDDRYWLPLILKGESINGEFHFGLNNEIVKYKVNILK